MNSGRLRELADHIEGMPPPRPGRRLVATHYDAAAAALPRPDRFSLAHWCSYEVDDDGTPLDTAANLAGHAVYRWPDEARYAEHFPAAAQRILGLSYLDASALFWGDGAQRADRQDITSREAAAALRMVAGGRDVIEAWLAATAAE